MPSGYYRHNQAHKAPPGAEPERVYETWEKEEGKDSVPAVEVFPDVLEESPASVTTQAPPSYEDILTPPPAVPEMQTYQSAYENPYTPPSAQPYEPPAATPSYSSDTGAVAPPAPDTRQVYSSYAPMPPVPEYGTPLTAQMDTTLWQGAADDLVSRLIKEFGVPTESVTLQSADSLTPEANSYFAEALQQALSREGFKIAQSSGSSPYILAYAASLLDPDNPSRALLNVKLKSGAQIVAEQSGLYEVTAAAPAQGAPAMIRPPE